LGLAVLSTIAAAGTHPVAGVSSATALTNGFASAFQVGAAITFAAAVVAAIGLRPRVEVSEERVAPSRELAEEPEALAA
jgi:hypothetical protein